MPFARGVRGAESERPRGWGRGRDVGERDHGDGRERDECPARREPPGSGPPAEHDMGTTAFSLAPVAVQPPRVTRACTWGWRCARSPKVWTTATNPQRKPSSSPAAAVRSPFAVSAAARASPPRSSRWCRMYTRSILGIVNTHWAWPTSPSLARRGCREDPKAPSSRGPVADRRDSRSPRPARGRFGERHRRLTRADAPPAPRRVWPTGRTGWVLPLVLLVGGGGRDRRRSRSRGPRPPRYGRGECRRRATPHPSPRPRGSRIS